jgi:hypothetical protein
VSLERDTVVWSRGLLSTPRVVKDMLQLMMAFMDRWGRARMLVASNVRVQPVPKRSTMQEHPVHKRSTLQEQPVHKRSTLQQQPVHKRGTLNGQLVLFDKSKVSSA